MKERNAVLLIFGIVIILILPLGIYAATYQQKVAPVTPQPIAVACSAFKNIGEQKGLNITDPSKLVKINKQIIAFVTEDQQLNQHLVLYNLGPDLLLGTRDDGQPQQAIPNDDGQITAVEVFNNTAAWLQTVPLEYEEIYLCSYPQCGSFPPQLVATNTTQYDFKGHLSLYGNKLAWSLIDTANRLDHSFMFCDLTKTGSPDGCAFNDTKTRVYLTLGRDEHVQNLKTTENNVYILTVENLRGQGFRHRMYIYNYNTAAVTLYYDETVKQPLLKEFDALTYDDKGADIFYALYNMSVDIDFIANGQGNFWNKRTLTKPEIQVLHMGAERNTKMAVDVSYIEKHTLTGKNGLSVLSPKGTFTIQLTDNERKVLEYSFYDNLNFVAIGTDTKPLYTHCGYQ
ncbi:hypothetical protein HYS50_03290 [Candidatus Woesearchaeota archaeon]|nr:hypothetical protein [Candidatus Woesearchaeota archaeon]